MTYVAMTSLTWPETEALSSQRPLGLIPTGAVEQHGPQLPLGTDCFIAEELARRIAAAIAGPVVVAPVVPGGLSSHHLAFPGTVTFSEELFGGAIDAYLEAFERIGIENVAIFSGHGGNLDFLGRYETAHAAGNSSIRLIAHHDLWGYVDAMFAGARAGGFEPVPTDIHAGGVETSHGLAIFPELVRPFDNVKGYTEGEEGWVEQMLANGMKSVSPSGVLGDVTQATATAGEQIFAHITDYLAAWIAETLDYERTDPAVSSASGSS
jgi:creatinine amidohydrolase